MPANKTSFSTSKITSNVLSALLITSLSALISTPNLATAKALHSKTPTTESIKINNSKPDSLAPMLKTVIPTVVNVHSEGNLPPVLFLQNQSNKQSLNQSKSQENNQDENQNDNNDFDQAPNEKELPNNQGQGKPSTEEPFIGEGSGVIISSKQGYIVTNAHVIKDADRITITLKDGRHFQAKLIGIDEPSDLAVVQIPAEDLPQIEFADPNSIEVGDRVIAIGNPFGLDQSVTSGIISALDRSDLKIESFESFIQTDAPINPGNSGGALVNTSGQLIGINTAILSPSKDVGNVGIGFAIPVSMVYNVAKQLIQYGKVERGIVGVMVQTLSPALANSMKLDVKNGAIVTEVAPNSPAEKAGIKVGDVITKIEDLDIRTANQIVTTMGFIRSGTEVNIEILRNNKLLTLKPVIIDRQKQKAIDQENNPYLYGLALQNFDQYNPAQGRLHGALVIGVSPDSNAWSSGIHPGDIILEANGEPVNDTVALQKAAEKTTDDFMLRISRQGNYAYIIIPKLQAITESDENNKDQGTK